MSYEDKIRADLDNAKGVIAKLTAELDVKHKAHTIDAVALAAFQAKEIRYLNLDTRTKELDAAYLKLAADRAALDLSTGLIKLREIHASERVSELRNVVSAFGQKKL